MGTKQHRLYSDGYDAKAKTAYEFYGDDWPGNPKVCGEQYLDRFDRQWHETLFLKATWGHDWSVREKCLVEWMGVGLEKLHFCGTMGRKRKRIAPRLRSAFLASSMVFDMMYIHSPQHVRTT